MYKDSALMAFDKTLVNYVLLWILTKVEEKFENNWTCQCEEFACPFGHAMHHFSLLQNMHLPTILSTFFFKFQSNSKFKYC